MKGEIEYKKGLWTEEEDKILMDFIRVHGKGKWSRVAKMTVLRRCGKSCRLRWINYLSPSVKRGDFSEEEEDLIIRLHNLLGNRWSLIAGRVPGRTDNQVKNHWNTHLSKKLRFKKRECRANASSKSGEADQGNPSTLPGSSSEKPTEPADGIGGSDQSATQDGSLEATRFNLSGQEVVIGTASYQTTCSFLPFVYEDMNMYTPQMMEYMDECALDYIWNGL